MSPRTLLWRTTELLRAHGELTRSVERLDWQSSQSVVAIGRLLANRREVSVYARSFAVTSSGFPRSAAKLRRGPGEHACKARELFITETETAAPERSNVPLPNPKRRRADLGLRPPHGRAVGIDVGLRGNGARIHCHVTAPLEAKVFFRRFFGHTTRRPNDLLADGERRQDFPFQRESRRCGNFETNPVSSGACV